MANFASVTVYQVFPNPAAPAEPAPKSVQRAVYLMYAGAVVYVISGIIGLIALATAAPGSPFDIRFNAGSTVTGEDSGTAPAAIVAMVVFSIVIPVVLWLWMAWKCKAGRSWARIVSTVFFALATLSTLISLADTGAWAVAGEIVGWLAGLGATILLWQRSSSWYFSAASRY